MIFRLANSYTSVEDATQEDIRALRQVTDFTYTHYIRRRGMPHPEKVESSVSLLNRTPGGRFSMPTGLVGRALETGADDWTVTDDRKAPQNAPKDAQSVEDLKGGILLRDYQEEAATAALQASRGVLSVPTGGGKTILTARLIQRAGCGALVLVPNLTLLKQTAEVLAGALGVDVGMIGGKHCTPRLVTVATPTKLRNWLRECEDSAEWFARTWRMFIADECHHVNLAGGAHKTTLWYNLLLRSKAYYKFGLTGTVPAEGTGKRVLLEAATGRVCYHRSTTEMIEEGYLSPVEIEVHPVYLHPRISDWRSAHDVHILGHARNQLITELVGIERAKGRSVLIIVNRKTDHGRVLHDLLPDALYADGETDSDLRERMLTEFREIGGTLIGTIFGEGVDIPRLDTVIMAAGGRSERQVIQRVGRALRKFAGKITARIIDFDDRDGGVLERHSKFRLQTYRRESGFKVRVVEPA